MNIADNSELYNDAFEQGFRFDLTRYLFAPNWCYKKIIKSNGSANEYGIHILSKLISSQYLYGNAHVDFELHNCFTLFWEKFFFKKPRVQKATARLEESGSVAKILTLVEDCEVDL